VTQPGAIWGGDRLRGFAGALPFAIFAYERSVGEEAGERHVATLSP
jgi:hypothetical protein